MYLEYYVNVIHILCLRILSNNTYSKIISNYILTKKYIYILNYTVNRVNQGLIKSSWIILYIAIYIYIIYSMDSNL